MSIQIRGIVVDERSGQPLWHSVVNITSQATGYKETTYTTRDGKFGVTAGAGEYRVKISHPLYRDTIISISTSAPVVVNMKKAVPIQFGR